MRNFCFRNVLQVMYLGLVKAITMFATNSYQKLEALPKTIKFSPCNPWAPGTALVKKKKFYSQMRPSKATWLSFWLVFDNRSISFTYQMQKAWNQSLSTTEFWKNLTFTTQKVKVACGYLPEGEVSFFKRCFWQEGVERFLRFLRHRKNNP